MEKIQAKLIIRNWNTSLKRRRYELAFWLREIANDLEKEDPNEYNKIFSAKFIIKSKN